MNKIAFSALILSILFPPILLPGMAEAQSQDPAMAPQMDAVIACQGETDDALRLKCFDGAVDKMKQARDSGDLMTVSRQDMESIERDAFGFNLPSVPRLLGLFGSEKNDESEPGPDEAVSETEKEALKRVMIDVARYEQTGRGRYRFYLTNGQVWQQTDSDNLRRPRAKDGQPLQVEIRKASFGSFLLQVNGKGKSVRVKRVE